MKYLWCVKSSPQTEDKSHSKKSNTAYKITYMTTLLLATSQNTVSSLKYKYMLEILKNISTSITNLTVTIYYIKK